MQNHQFENLEPRRRPATVVPYIIIALLVIVLAILLFVFFFSPATVSNLRSAAGLSTPQDQSTEQASSGSSSSGDRDTSLITQSQNAEDSTAPENSVDDQRAGSEGNNPFSGNTAPFSSDNISCDEGAASIESFFQRLDSRGYIQAFKLDAPSVEYFPLLIQKLVDNPPIVSGETDDLFSILQNTAHFFRII
ncbi:MAG: hypothetical protein P8X39_01585, partial [Desulfofustis sp.]